MKTDTIAHHYAIAALWSSTDDAGEPLDAQYTADDMAPESLEKMTADCEAFLLRAGDLIKASGLDHEQIGHDFWLTRNNHGTGFWDRGLGDVGDQLTALCKSFGEVWLYVGDDGLIYC